jgi:hypothetical protein
MDLLVNAFKDTGIDPSVNYPFKGGYITERYGTGQVQAVQCEINKALFESEETLEIQADGFARIKDVMNGDHGGVGQDPLLSSQAPPTPTGPRFSTSSLCHCAFYLDGRS